jgi:hypothetical protein
MLERIRNTRKGYEDLGCNCDWLMSPLELRAQKEEDVYFV